MIRDTYDTITLAGLFCWKTIYFEKECMCSKKENKDNSFPATISACAFLHALWPQTNAFAPRDTNYTHFKLYFLKQFYNKG